MFLIDIFLILLVLVLVAFILTVGVHLFILRTPYVPTPKAIARAMVRSAELHGGETVMDLGAGDARLLLAAERAHPGITAVGCELVPTIWLLGWLNLRLRRSRAVLHLRSALTEDVTRADVVFLYMMPHVMESLEGKFDLELRPGAKVVSHAFRFPGRQPTREVTVPWGRRWKKIYVYTW